ncbi:hypothetical protein DMUE_2720 [Dictyocoela muelleri]|nr:hypothetical protein DMUE_2720 [Dictyocoela muelleri]
MDLTDGDYRIGHTSKKEYLLTIDDGNLKMKNTDKSNNNMAITITKERNKFLFKVNDNYIVRKGMIVVLSHEKNNNAYWDIEGVPEYSKIKNGELCLDYGFFENGEYNVYMGFCNTSSANQRWRISLISLGIDSQLDLLIKRDMILAKREDADLKDYKKRKSTLFSNNSIFREFGNYRRQEPRIIELPH